MLSLRLKNLRNSKNLTQSELAKILGVARTTYAMYEQGKREPDYETLQKIADFFEVSFDYILGREEKRTKEGEVRTINGQQVDMGLLTADQRLVIEWALQHEDLSFKDQPDSIFELIEQIRNAKPYLEKGLQEQEEKKERGN